MKFFLYLSLLFQASLAHSNTHKQALTKSTAKGHRPLSYKAARLALFGKIYLQRDQQGSYIKDIYCKVNFRKEDGVGPLKIPNHKRLNTEHAWPKTRFSKKYPFDTQKSDLFHLFPTASKANNFRGDLIFSEVEDIGDDIPGCTLSTRGIVLNSKVLAFSPPDDIKGDLARALFYFSVRYNEAITDLEEKNLRDWHVMDPVDDFEKEKNNIVERYQGNRNPFIDNPKISSLIKDF